MNHKEYNNNNNDNNNEWTAPVGNLCEISLETYLNGVESQIPHSMESSQYDTILNMDISSSASSSSSAAAVTLTVGNGSQTILFRDHLLLGRGVEEEDDSSWKILSKTFSPQPWPTKK